MSTIGTDKSDMMIARWHRYLDGGVTKHHASVVVAVVTSGVAIGVRLALAPYLSDDRAVYLFGVAAVLVSASLCGTLSGVLSTVLVALAVNYIWIAPRREFGLQRWQDVLVLVIFLGVGLMISVLAGRLRRAKRCAELLAADEAAARLAAQQSEQRFRRIFEQGPLGMALVGLDRRIMDVNPMLCRMLGYGHEELIGRTVDSLTYPPDVEQSLVLVQQLNEGVIPNYSLVKRYLRKCGEPLWVIISVTVVRDASGRPAYSLGMVQDISERKRMELALERAKDEAEAANRAKDQFLAVLSHELRTPLSPVLLTASSMEADASLPGPVRENLHMIRQNVELEARLIDDLLDLTGIARGKISLHRTHVDVHAVINQALRMVQQDLLDNRLTVHTQLGAARSAVDGDPARLQQVFWNLLKNAVKFTPAGGEITIRTSNDGPPGHNGDTTQFAPSSILIEVQDTGVGIPEDVLPRLFRPFEQGPADVTHQYGGLGLGLAISRSIVELHDGQILASSEGANRGATFTVLLPLSPHPSLAPPPPIPYPAPSPRKRGPLHILLVEDHPATRRAMASILQALGHEICTAATLADALALAAAETFDLIISDLALPDGSGHDLMRQIKARGRSPHGVAVSGYGMPDDIRRSRDAGFDEHLTKPVSQEKIREVLSHVGA